jgi:hypothetical protein
MAARSKGWVCDSSPAEIAGLNPVGVIGACMLWVLCVVRERSLRRADQSSRGVLPTVVRRFVWSRKFVYEEAVAHWWLLIKYGFPIAAPRNVHKFWCDVFETVVTYRDQSCRILQSNFRKQHSLVLLPHYIMRHIENETPAGILFRDARRPSVGQARRADRQLYCTQL